MKITTPGTAVTWRRYAQDGTAHLTYYRTDAALSFVWDCDPAHPIEVENGGYGEDLVHVVTLEESDLPEDVPTTPKGWAGWFKRTCDEVADSFPRIEPL